MAPRPARYRRKSSPSKAYSHRKPESQRALRYAIIAALVFIILLLYGSTKVPVVPDLHQFHHAPSHKPPAQKNSTSAEVRWYSDLKWLKPWSTSVTQEEDRSLLPPLKDRPPIYTFYDTEEKKDEKVRAAENKLLLIWRRAWWAQGFTPVVLGRSEAMNDPHYEKFQEKKLLPQLEADLVRWLAWGQMGPGILANWLLLPMGAHNGPMLSYMRKGDYSKLKRYEGLAGGLYIGEKKAINNAIAEALSSPGIKEAKSLEDSVSKGTIVVESKPSELAFYDANANAEYYKSITAALAENKAKGLYALAELINSHLHLTFLNAFPNGFAVLSPFADTTTVVPRAAHALAKALQSCPSSPMPSSCPPNNQKCSSSSLCVGEYSAALPITSPSVFTNDSDTYTIGTIPHPYTLASLKGKTKEITTRHIRRDTSRDPWLNAITQKTMGKDLGGQGRIVSFKSMVASDWAFARSLWMTESPQLGHRDFEYHFGFALPPFLNATFTPFTLPSPSSSSSSTDGKKDSSIEATDDKINHHPPSQKELRNQQSLLDLALDVLASPRPTLSALHLPSLPKDREKKKKTIGMREMVEAWNLADTEAWRFVRAFAARERVSRGKWEDAERRFAGGKEAEEEDGDD